MSKFGASSYNSSSLGGNTTSSLIQNQVVTDSWQNNGQEDDWPKSAEQQQGELDVRIQQIANEPADFALGVGHAIGTLFSSLNGALARAGSYIPNPLPMAEAASINKDKKAKSKRVSFDDFFDKHTKNKIKVRTQSGAVSKDSREMKTAFKKICKEIAKSGDLDLVKYFLRHVEGVDIADGKSADFKSVSSVLVSPDSLSGNSNVGAFYDLNKNSLKIFTTKGKMKFLSGLVRHEMEHFVQSATRSFMSRDFLNSCYDEIAKIGQAAESCIMDDELCERYDFLLRASEGMKPVTITTKGGKSGQEVIVPSIKGVGGRACGFGKKNRWHQ